MITSYQSVLPSLSMGDMSKDEFVEGRYRIQKGWAEGVISIGDVLVAMSGTDEF